MPIHVGLKGSSLNLAVLHSGKRPMLLSIQRPATSGSNQPGDSDGETRHRETCETHFCVQESKITRRRALAHKHCRPPAAPATSAPKCTCPCDNVHVERNPGPGTDGDDMPFVSAAEHRFEAVDAELYHPQRLHFTPSKDPLADTTMDVATNNEDGPVMGPSITVDPLQECPSLGYLDEYRCLHSIQPKAGTSSLEANTFHDGHEWHHTGSPSEITWYTAGSLLQARAGTRVVNGKMRIKARAPGPQTIYRAGIYGVWIAATLAQPGDTIVVDNKGVTKAVIHTPHLQTSDYDLHHASYSLVIAKQLTVPWARGHRDPRKAHNLQDYQDRMGNELADEEAKTAGTMHPSKGAGSTSPADILLNKHVMPSLDCQGAAPRADTGRPLDILAPPLCVQSR